MGKPAAKEEMSFTTLAFIIIVALALGSAAKEGAFSSLGGSKHGPRRHGFFTVSVEWHALVGGVRYRVTRNGAAMTPKDPMLVRATSPSKAQIHPFPGWSTDKVHVDAREISPEVVPDPTGYLFVSIIFKGDDGQVSLPEYERDPSPVSLSGVKANW